MLEDPADERKTKKDFLMSDKLLLLVGCWSFMMFPSCFLVGCWSSLYVVLYCVASWLSGLFLFCLTFALEVHVPLRPYNAKCIQFAWHGKLVVSNLGKDRSFRLTKLCIANTIIDIGSRERGSIHEKTSTDGWFGEIAFV